MIKLIKENTNFHFVEKRFVGYIISGIIILAGFILFFIKGVSYGIDFTGGTLIELRFNKPIPITDLRHFFSGMGDDKAVIQAVEGGKEYIVKLKPGSKIVKQEINLNQNLEDKLKYGFKNNNVEIRRIETVGPRIGKELQQKALWALLLGLLIILVYVGLRINIKFGIGSVIALFHDAFITLTIISFAGVEISIPVIAALLTIIGYSINDSIVVSVRIQEYLKRAKRHPLHEILAIINKGINATLSRTVITSLTTFFVVLSLYIFGARTIRDFSLTMLIGIIVGTYSSIFVVAPLVYELSRLTHKSSSKEKSLLKTSKTVPAQAKKTSKISKKRKGNKKSKRKTKK